MRRPHHQPDHDGRTGAPDPIRRDLLRTGFSGGSLWALGALAPLAACGGGAEEDPGAPGTEPAADRRAPLRGVDTGGTGARASTFFSMALTTAAPPTAGGVLFDTAGTVFVDGDGAPFPPSALAPGMNAEISAGPVTGASGSNSGPSNPNGTGSTSGTAAQPRARALRWRSAEQLSGAVQATDAGAATLTVLGQRVNVTPATVLDPALGTSWSRVAPGTRVRIWGELDSTAERFVASRIDAGARNDRDVLRGVLTQLDADRVRVTAGGVVAEALPGTVLLGSDVLVGQVVRLALAPDAATGLGGAPAQLLAVRADALRVPDAVAAELEGRVTQLVSPTQFAVDGVAVDARGAALPPSAALVLGARVNAQGRMVQGRLLATQVQVQSDSGDPVAELEGRVQSVQFAARSFVLRGVTVRWSSQTRFEGGSAALISAGRKLAVKGRYVEGRTLVDASAIHVEA